MEIQGESVIFTSSYSNLVSLGKLALCSFFFIKRDGRLIDRGITA